MGVGLFTVRARGGMARLSLLFPRCGAVRPCERVRGNNHIDNKDDDDDINVDCPADHYSKKNHTPTKPAGADHNEHNHNDHRQPVP